MKELAVESTIELKVEIFDVRAHEALVALNQDIVGVHANNRVSIANHRERAGEDSDGCEMSGQARLHGCKPAVSWFGRLSGWDRNGLPRQGCRQNSS